MSESNGLPLTTSTMAAPVSAPAPQEQPVVQQEASTTAATAPAPATTTPPSTVAATAAAATAAVGATPMNGAASPGESLICDWGNCKQVLPSAEALYVSFTLFDLATVSSLAMPSSMDSRVKNTSVDPRFLIVESTLT